MIILLFLDKLTPLLRMKDRFKQAVLPSLLMGVLTNIYILGLFAWLGITEAFLSPVVGIGVFLAGYVILKLDIISAHILFIIASYVVALEVSIHTSFLGWNSGFFYFLFLLPTVFLLKTTWKLWALIAYNVSVVVIIGLLRYHFYSCPPKVIVSDTVLSFISLLNASVTGFVVLVVMYFFSRTIASKDEALMLANVTLEAKNAEVSMQHQHLEVLLKEVHHRVKNNLQIISSLISLQERTIEDKEVAAVLNETKRRVEAIALIHQKLYQGDRINRVFFDSYLRELIESQKLISPNVHFDLSSVEAELSLDASVPLGLILSEIITNSVKHAFNGIVHPSIAIELTLIDDEYALSIHDNGVGVPEDFDLNNPQSLGMEIVLALVEQIDAKIEVIVNQGTKFTITFKDIP